MPRSRKMIMDIDRPVTVSKKSRKSYISTFLKKKEKEKTQLVYETDKYEFNKVFLNLIHELQTSSKIHMT